MNDLKLWNYLTTSNVSSPQSSMSDCKLCVVVNTVGDSIVYVQTTVDSISLLVQILLMALRLGFTSWTWSASMFN